MAGKIFSLDAETNGLYGQAFAIAALVYENGEKVDQFIGRCPIEVDVEPWVAENVLPKMQNISVTDADYRSMLERFSQFYMRHKGACIIAHYGAPVEARVFYDMVKFELIGPFDGPYPLHEVGTALVSKGFDASSVDDYLINKGIKIPEYEGGTHNPLYDAAVAATVWHDLFK